MMNWKTLSVAFLGIAMSPSVCLAQPGLYRLVDANVAGSIDELVNADGTFSLFQCNHVADANPGANNDCKIIRNAWHLTTGDATKIEKSMSARGEHEANIGFAEAAGGAIGGEVLGAVVAEASIGAVAGPWGAGVGAIVGLGVGGYEAYKKRTEIWRLGETSEILEWAINTSQGVAKPLNAQQGVTLGADDINRIIGEFK